MFLRSRRHGKITESRRGRLWVARMGVRELEAAAVVYVEAISNQLMYAWFDGSQWHPQSVDSPGQRARR